MFLQCHKSTIISYYQAVSERQWILSLIGWSGRAANHRLCHSRGISVSIGPPMNDLPNVVKRKAYDCVGDSHVNISVLTMSPHDRTTAKIPAILS